MLSRHHIAAVRLTFSNPISARRARAEASDVIYGTHYPDEGTMRVGRFTPLDSSPPGKKLRRMSAAARSVIREVESEIAAGKLDRMHPIAIMVENLKSEMRS